MGKSHPPYAAEFRAEAVRLVRSGGRGVGAAARDLGVSEPALRQWCRDAELAAVKSARAPVDDRVELDRLRRECRILREERDILGKAAVLLGRDASGRP